MEYDYAIVSGGISGLYIYFNLLKNLLLLVLSFNFFLALFPAIIFLLTLIAYLPYEGLKNQLDDPPYKLKAKLVHPEYIFFKLPQTEM